MLEIRSTKKGYVANQEISPRLFEQVGNTIVRVICEVPCYVEANTLENSICTYMNSSMPDGIEVKTNHVTIHQSSGEDTRGKYIENLDFQVCS